MALSALVDVEVALAEAAAKPHLTTPCHVGAHETCQTFCLCEDCDQPCQCECHLVP